MQVFRTTERRIAPSEGTTVTIGAYDGVHRGHQAVIDRVRTIAADRGTPTAVATFDRHPASVVRPESAPRLLTDLDQRLELLEACGVDITLVIQFDEVRARESAEDFVIEVLVECLATRVVVVGTDFHFGHGRLGNVARLQEMGAERGFDVLGLELVGVDGAPADPLERVSSTSIRQALAAGDLEAANRLLGRCHEVRGPVERGDGRGGELLDMPTANLAVPDEIQLPKDGIYAGRYVRPDGTEHPAAVSVGRRPTFYDAQPFSLVEAHLLDFDGDLYGEAAKLRFVARIRDERRFDDVGALAAQMKHDVSDARRILEADAS